MSGPESSLHFWDDDMTIQEARVAEHLGQAVSQDLINELFAETFDEPETS